MKNDDTTLIFRKLKKEGTTLIFEKGVKSMLIISGDPNGSRLGRKMVRLAFALGSKSFQVLSRRHFAILASSLPYVKRIHGQNCEATNENK